MSRFSAVPVAVLAILFGSLLFGSQRLLGDQPTDGTDGIWHPVSAVLGGKELPKEFRDSVVLKLSGDQYSVTVNGQPDKGTCVLDFSTKPHRMTITGTVGPNMGKTLLAIFELTKPDLLRVCYDVTGKAFPTEFKSAPDSTHYLAEYRKELPKGAELSGRVLNVPDGDAIELLAANGKKFRIRLNGIDAPEMNQPFGSQSREALSLIVAEKTVRVVTQGEDRIGQVIGDVFFRSDTSDKDEPEVHLNDHLVAKGLAWHFVRFAPDNSKLANSEKQARESKLGLWAGSDPVSPWDWRRMEAEKQK